MSTQYSKSDFDWTTKFLLGFSILLVVFSFFAPFVFTRKAINEEFSFIGKGEVGDAIGGLMNPFIAIAGVIITGLAFYIQYKANLQQRELFEKELDESKKQFDKQIEIQNKQVALQQFESQFYELIRLHRENVSEMIINGYDFEEGKNNKLKRYEKNTEGRKIFVVMITELESILNCYTKVFGKLDSYGFRICYSIFFSGLDSFANSSRSSSKDFLQVLFKARKRHQEPNDNNIQNNLQRKEFDDYCTLYFNYKPFSGHAQRLGHYFRNLFLTVRLVVDSDIAQTYQDKMKYLNILRAQLSNHEQILLFYNWLSEYGEVWENNQQQYFTEYCMIRNLWHTSLYSDEFIQKKVNELRAKPVKQRQGELFEVDKYQV